MKEDDQILYDTKEDSIDEEIFEEHLIELKDDEDEIKEDLESQLEEFLIPHTLPIKRKYAVFQQYCKTKKAKIELGKSKFKKFKLLSTLPLKIASCIFIPTTQKFFFSI